MCIYIYTVISICCLKTKTDQEMHYDTCKRITHGFRNDQHYVDYQSHNKEHKKAKTLINFYFLWNLKTSNQKMSILYLEKWNIIGYRVVFISIHLAFLSLNAQEWKIKIKYLGSLILSLVSHNLQNAMYHVNHSNKYI